MPSDLQARERGAAKPCSQDSKQPDKVLASVPFWRLARKLK